VRIFRHHWRPAATAALASAAILGGAVACGSSVPGGAYAAATSTATPGTAGASASPSGGALASVSADEIARRAIANLKKVSSVHIAGWFTDSGQRIAMNLSLGNRGCTGTLAIKKEGSFRVLKIGKKLWIKPDNKFWKYAAGSAAGADSAAMQILSGKYIEPNSKDSSLKAMGAFCSPSQFASDFDSTQVTGMIRGTTTTISGQPALQIKDIGDTASAYVTIASQPEILRLDSGSSGRLDFTRYNVPLDLTPPPANETLDGSKYGF
jgi:hypothetical protein